MKYVTSAGVTKRRKRYYAECTIGERRISRGFATIEEARDYLEEVKRGGLTAVWRLRKK